MDSVQKIQTALEALRKTAVKGKTKKSVLENIDNVSSSVVLLNSSSSSALTFDKLVSVFRTLLVPLYSSYTDPALNVASTILKTVFNNHIRPCIRKDKEGSAEHQVGWERVAHSLLSGVIDFLESNNNDKCKASIAKAFYAPICSFFFKNNTRTDDIGITLRCTAYMLLSDTATLHQDNQSRLRDQKFIGPRALGLTISRTRDFAVLEALLILFAILLPSSSIPQKRNSYIRAVFSALGREVIELLEDMPTRQWDETAAKVVDILADSDISFPQPFDVDEIVVCGNKYPQPEVSDRFYVDRTCFFVNVQQEDGLYEDLQITYGNIQGIRIAPAGETTTPVFVLLRTVPKLSDQAIPSQNGPLKLHVDILNRDFSRFKKALHHRNLEQAITGTKKSRISVCESLDLDEDSLRWQRTASLPSQKAKNVEDFYESDQLQAPADENQVIGHSMKSSSACMDKETDLTANAGPENPRNLDGLSTAFKLNASIFGGSNEELSDIDDNNVSDNALKTKAQLPGAKNAVAHTTSKPANVILLSDDESVAEIKPSSAKKPRTKKCPERRVDLDEAISDKPKSKPGQKATKGASSNAVASKKTRDAAFRTGGKSATEKMEVYRKADDTSGRPRRTAATAASAKLAETFAVSGSSNVAAVPQENGASSPPSYDAEDSAADINECNDAHPTKTVPLSKTIATPLKSKQPERSGKRASSPFEIGGLRSSSPTSKISRMKAKNPPAATKPITGKSRKRPNDENVRAKEEAISRKKPRVNYEGVRLNEDDEGTLKNDHPYASVAPPQKYGHRGRKGKTATMQKSVDWDKVPTEPMVTFNQQRDSSPIKPARATTPASVTSKKKNIVKPSDTSKFGKLATPTTDKPERKTQARSCLPLQTISQAQNEAMKEHEHVPRSDDASPLKALVDDRKKNRRPADMASMSIDKKTRRNVLPSFEDVLLKGTAVEKTEVPQKATEPIEVPDDDEENGEANLDFGNIEEPPFAMDLDGGPDEHEDNQDIQPDKPAAINHEEPSTPLLKNPKPKDSMPIPRVSMEKSRLKSLDLDADMFDLTDDGIKEVLQSPHARRTEKERKLGHISRPQKLTIGKPLVNELREGRESSADENEAPAIKEMPLRPKVAFDEKLRYKSASLESLPVQEFAESRPLGPGRMHRLTESKSTSRGPSEMGNRKRHENQAKKELGMEDIINVLDSIQNVIVSNIANKSRSVRSDIRAARDRLIHEAMVDLHEMREESVAHYNNLLLLENEYANMNRKLNTGFENAMNINTDICKFVRQTINTHDHGSLSKTMPQSLFASDLPASFQKFT